MVGGVVVVRDNMGCLIYAYTLNLGNGTSNWAEEMSLLFGIMEKVIPNSWWIVLMEVIALHGE